MDVAVSRLKKSDFTEIKSLANPPQSVKDMFEAVNVLKTGKPGTWAEFRKEMAKPENYMASLV